MLTEDKALRDQFAMAILKCLIDKIASPVMPTDLNLAIRESNRGADAMMEARKKC